MKLKFAPLATALLFLHLSCRKAETSEQTQTNIPEVLSEFSYKVAYATYSDLEQKSNQLHSKIMSFNSTNTSSDLEACKQLWKDTRAAWEQSEAFLFGPVATEDIDPAIDDWPVNQQDLDSLLASNQVFSQGFLDSTQTTLKGFHPMEYLLFGANGSKTPGDFTVREHEYLVALADYIKRLTTTLRKTWEPTEPGNYLVQFTQAGSNGNIYASKRAAVEELVNAMIGICEEVADGKIQEPLAAQDPKLEESQFSKNSITDFKNNIISVQNAYNGNYTENGIGLNNWVNQNNISLDNKVQQKIVNAINAFDLITIPFGEAIISQQNQLATVQQALRDLKAVLEDELLSFVQQTITE